MLTIPAALVVSVSAYVMTTYQPPARSTSPNLLTGPRHPITGEMEAGSARLARKAAPDFELTDTTGKLWTRATVAAGKPLVVLAIKDECPCSLESQPFFNDLAKQTAGGVQFVGIINVPPVVAEKYRTDMNVPFPILSETGETTFRAFDFPRSVYVTLIDKDGKIVRQWPGYGRAMLIELAEAIATETGTAPAKLDVTMAPEEPTSGCALLKDVPQD